VLLGLPILRHYYQTCGDLKARKLLQAYIYSLIIAFICWQIDYHFCWFVSNKLPINPQFHNWWHNIMAIHSYYGANFLVFIRLSQLRRQPQVRYYKYTKLPYIFPSIEEKDS